MSKYLSTKGKEIRAYQHLMFERFLIWLDVQFSSGKDIYDLLVFFREDELRCSEAVQFLRKSTMVSLDCAEI